ncbi:MAG: hypothetical protein H0V81_01415 [Solirubrobacterales bacterium]|nr:hypothetical protein [Solirubrobacterales bacterium]
MSVADSSRDLLVRWNAALANAEPGYVAMIDRFDPGERDAARAAHAWLVTDGLRGESVPYLWIRDGELLGFFSLAMGQIELRSSHLKRLDPPQQRPTQPAVLLTWIVKTPRPDVDGEWLLLQAVGLAGETASTIAATVLALDPFDIETADMWAKHYGARASKTRLHGGTEERPLKRMFLELP